MLFQHSDASTWNTWVRWCESRNCPSGNSVLPSVFFTLRKWLATASLDYHGGV